MILAFLDEKAKVRKKRVGNPRVGNPVSLIVYLPKK